MQLSGQALGAPLEPVGDTRRRVKGAPPETNGDRQPQEEEEVKRQINWTLGVVPQDVRFPTDICEVAFTDNYFAALTKDRVKIFVNRRVPEEKSNCKKKTIDFEIDGRPTAIVSYENRDTLCVLFESKIDFYSLISLEKVGSYQAPQSDILLSASAMHLRTPLAALWCHRDTKKPSGCGRLSSLTVWHEQVLVPQSIPLTNVLRKSEKYMSFKWTSNKTLLMYSKLPAPKSKKHLSFCSFDLATFKPVSRITKRKHSKYFSLSPNGSLLLLVSSSQYQLLDAISLRRLRVLPRTSAQKLPKDVECVINDNSDMIVLDRRSVSLEFFNGLQQIHRPNPTRRCDLSKVHGVHDQGASSLYAIGTFGALFVFHDEGVEKNEESKQLSSYSIAILLDLQGRVLLRAHWPRSFVQMVTDELLVNIQYLCMKPFSAAHARIFNFSGPLSKKSYWLQDLNNAE